MKLQGITMTIVLAVACAAPGTAAPQTEGPASDKQPIVSNTGRFGDPDSVARMYQDFLYGVIKEKDPNELTLTKTKFGVDQTYKLNKKTKFIQNGKRSSLDKLKVGDQIFVDVDTDKKTGDQIAKKVISGVMLPSIPTEK